MVNSALLWSLIEGQFIISYPASEGMRKERKRVSHRFPDPAHTLLDLEMLVIGLVNFVFVNCGVCLRTAIWHNPQIITQPVTSSSKLIHYSKVRVILPRTAGMMGVVH